jgi:hypothetical protein
MCLVMKKKNEEKSKEKKYNLALKLLIIFWITHPNYQGLVSGPLNYQTF